MYIKDFTLSLVVPCFNEQDAIPIFLTKIQDVFAPYPNISLEIIFVNDGSSDQTLKVLRECQSRDDRFIILDLSRNFGKEAALSAGLMHTSGDAIVPIDVDLQDPPEIILSMIEKWRDGYDVVLARRSSRVADSFLKRATAKSFYKVHNCFSNVKIPENVGDFRLMDRAVVDAIKSLPETCRFMKGIFAWVGFNTTVIDYERPARIAGASKFNGWKLWNFALDGITSFSTVPLRAWTYVGSLMALYGFLHGIYIFLRTAFLGVDVPGYASLMVAIFFLGGIQLIGIGVLGEYLGRNYMESKRRPLYIVKKVYKRNAVGQK